MRNIWNITKSLLGPFRDAVILKYFIFKYPQVNFGRCIRLGGIPIFQIESHAKVIMGGGIRFRNTTKSNPVGIYKKCSIAVLNGAELTIGDDSGFSGVSIYCANKIVIGKNLTCGGNVSIWDTDFHPLEYSDRHRNNKEAIKTAPIFIGDDVFIGAHAIILKGVTIGNRSIIATGSIVTKDIPEDQIWGGNPAKFLRKLDN